jgi:NADPH:quinone reductase-like Zn-dependent oxidoreductase
MLIAKNEIFGGPEVVRIVDVPIPEPKAHEVLIRVGATTVSVADSRLRSRNVPRGFRFILGLLFGFSKPKYGSLGTEAAGEVVKKGSEVSRFNLGDRVVVNMGMRLGGHAQYSVLNERAAIAKIPAKVSTETAAAMVFGGVTALVYLRDKVKIRSGERLLVVGAGGAVGSAAIQLGKKFGAHVTGVCSSGKIAAVTSLGADHVIDYTKQDWRELNERYDVILDAVGGTDFRHFRKRLTPTGRVGLIVADLPMTLMSVWFSLTHKQKMFAGPAAESTKDLEFLLSLCESGEFTPLISQVLPLSRITEAHALVDSGRKLGSVVITP